MDTGDTTSTAMGRPSTTAVADTVITAPQSTGQDSMGTKVDLRGSGAIKITTQLAGTSVSPPSVATSPGAANSAAAASVTAKAYDARFARAVACLCAEQPSVRVVVDRLVGAVRDAAAVVSQVHSEEFVDHQCALLSRMFEFDGFLW